MPAEYYKGKFSGYQIDEILTEMEELIQFYNKNKMKFVYSDDIRNIEVVSSTPGEEEDNTLYVIKKGNNK